MEERTRLEASAIPMEWDRAEGLTRAAPAATAVTATTVAPTTTAAAVVVAPEVAATEAGTAAAPALGLAVRGGAGAQALQPAWHLLVRLLHARVIACGHPSQS